MDYYQILGISNDSSYQEIKRQYNKRVLLYHPDKISTKNEETNLELTTSSSKGNVKKNFLLLQEAFTVLRDENKRKSYDEKLRNLKQQRPQILVYEEVDLDDMDFDEENKIYSTSCARCQGQSNFRISELELEEDIDLIQCNNCSFTIRILYEKVAQD